MKSKRKPRDPNWKKKCKKFAEYYKTNNPNWSDEQCKDAAKKYCRECNWQCIEYWQKKYPDKSIDELEGMRNDHVKNMYCRSKMHIEYWLQRYPEAEAKRLFKKHCLETNWQNVEYWQKKYPDKSIEDIKKIISNATAASLKKRPDSTGINNPAHRSKTTELERKSRSPFCIEFYLKKYPGISQEEATRMCNETKTKVQIKPDYQHPMKTEYYTHRGYTEEEARKMVSDRGRTFSLQKCIEKYGEVEGRKRFEERQTKWQKSLHQSFMNGDRGVSQSHVQTKMYNELVIKFPTIKEEINIGPYSYDMGMGKKLIEFNGDYWHANPNKYSADFYNKVNKKTAAEIWERDKQKAKYATDLGYEVLVVWEDDYRKNKSETMTKIYEFLS